MRARPAIPFMPRRPPLERVQDWIARFDLELPTMLAAIVFAATCIAVTTFAACSLTPAQVAAIEQSASAECTGLLPLATDKLPPSVRGALGDGDALACQGAEDLLGMALAEAVKSTPVRTATSPIKAPVYHPATGALMGIVPQHLADGCARALAIASVDAGAK